MKAYQSIQTKFIGPTNSRGARIKAYTASWGDMRGLSITVPFSYELREEERHWEAVKALISKHDLKWGREFAIGASVDGRGYVFVPVRSSSDIAVLEGR